MRLRTCYFYVQCFALCGFQRIDIKKSTDGLKMDESGGC